MGYSIDWSDLEQRIQDQKAALLDTSQNMDPERLKFLVETYDECKGESVFITRAKLFEKVTARKEPQQRRKSTGAKTAGGAARSAAKTAAKKETQVQPSLFEF